MQVYLYDSLDGDVQVFSTMENALGYAKEQHGPGKCEQQNETMWLIFDEYGDSSEIRLATIDKPE